MRRRISTVVAGVLAAVTVLATADVASAAPETALAGTTFTSIEQAGYAATNAQFRYVKATEFLRDPTQYLGVIPVTPEAISVTWPQAVVQPCVVHLIGAFLRHASCKVADVAGQGPAACHQHS